MHKLCTYHTHIPYTPRYKHVKFISRNIISEDELLDCDISDDISISKKYTIVGLPRNFPTI